MSFLSKPVRNVFTFVFFLQFLTLVVGYKLDPKSCTGTVGAHVKRAMEEVEDMVAYAEQRSNVKAQTKRDGTLLQDLLDASNEDDTQVLKTAGGWFSKVRVAIAKSDLIIHCNDKHLTNGGQIDVYFDNSDGRQARVQVLNVAGRGKTACGGVQRAFAYDFNNAKTQKHAGEAIVLCADKVGALTVANKDPTQGNIKFWKDRNLLSQQQGIDFLNGFLSYMLLHELMHATDHKQFPGNPGGRPELYGYQEITGNKVGATGAKGPSSIQRLHNADSYAYLASAWYLESYHFEAGKFTLTKKADRPPATLAELKKKLGGRKRSMLQTRAPNAGLNVLALEARELTGFEWPKAGDHTELEARDLAEEFDYVTDLEAGESDEDAHGLESRASKKKTTKAKPKKTVAKAKPKKKTKAKPKKKAGKTKPKKTTPKKKTQKASTRKPTATSACPATKSTTKPKKGVRGLLERAAKKVKGKNTKTATGACATSLPPLVTAIGDAGKEFKKIVPFKGKVEKIPDADEKRRRFAAVMTARPTSTSAVPMVARATEGFVTSMVAVN